MGCSVRISFVQGIYGLSRGLLRESSSKMSLCRIVFREAAGESRIKATARRGPLPPGFFAKIVKALALDAAFFYNEGSWCQLVFTGSGSIVR